MSKNKKLIWDIPTRLFHWAIVITLCYSWYSIEVEGDLDHHFLSGFIALGLILFRIIWGLVGSRYAKFSSFIYKPSEIIAYAKTFFRREGGKYAGHNPLGGLSVLALLLVIFIQAGTGLFADDEYYYFAPLNDYVSSSMAGKITEFHGTNAKVILGLAIFHIVVILFYRLYKREKLVLAMITGKKPDDQDRYEPIPGSRWVRAIILALVVFAAVYGVVNYL
jgi:cytochrome b